MAYTDFTQPAVIAQRVGAGGALWWYTTTEAITVVRVDGYIADAEDLGMQVGDAIIVIDSDATPVSMQVCIVSAINADGSADLSDGTAIAASDTD